MRAVRIAGLIAALGVVACGSGTDAPGAPVTTAGAGGAATSSATGAGGGGLSAGGAGGSATTSTGHGGAGGGTTTSAGGAGTSRGAAFAQKLGRPARFLVGMGNDLVGAEQGYDQSKCPIYSLGPTLDLHYAYLVGLPGQGGWPDWNDGGSFANIVTDTSDAKGVVPMLTLYAMASWGDGNLAGLADDAFMGPYWQGVKLLFQRLALFDKAAVVHVEPDFWGYAEKQSGGDPTKTKVNVTKLVPECAGLSDDLVGFGHCLVKLARAGAPKALVGFHASRWGGTAESTAAFLSAVGAGEGDFVASDLLDRDAGCFEAHVDPNCQRDDGPWYWDETNQASPNFHEHFAWSKAVADGVGQPMLYWQVPFGVPSDAPGGTAGHYRDNRVKYLFAHVDEMIAAGVVGAAFGTGADHQTFVTTDGGQFQKAVTAYFASPVALP
jgi:hypothetical protein